MKTKIKRSKNSKVKYTKKTGNNNLNDKESKSLKYQFFNKEKNRNKISLIIDFLDINEQLLLLKLNSIFLKILINKKKLPLKSIEALVEFKNSNNFNISKYSNLYSNFKNIIKYSDIDEKEYPFIISYLLKNIKINFINFELFERTNIEDDFINKYKIFFLILSRLKFVNKITHIKFDLHNPGKQIKDIHLNKEVFNILHFSNLFKNINNLEIENIKNSICLMNKMLNYKNNDINNVTMIKISDINMKINTEEIIDLNIYNSLSFPELTNLKYLSLKKVNLSIFCLNEIIFKNSNLKRLSIINCSIKNISLYNEKEYVKILIKSLNNCNQLNYTNFNNNNFSIYITSKILYILLEKFFKSDKMNFTLLYGYPINNEEKDDKSCIFEFPKHLKEYMNIKNKKDYDKTLYIQFNSKLSYSIKKNKYIIEVSDLQKEQIINGIYSEKIKLTLDTYKYNSSKIKKVMEKYYQKGITKYLQIFCSFPKFSAINIIEIPKSNNEMYESIEKVTINFDKEGSSGKLFGDRIILSILSFFPCAKIISFKNVYFDKHEIKLYDPSEIYELFDNENDKYKNNKKGKRKAYKTSDVLKLLHNNDDKNDKNNKNHKNDKNHKNHKIEINKKDNNDKNDCFEFVLFGEKNKDLELFKNKERCLKEIRFKNCHFHHCLIGKDITQEIEKKINSYLGKNVIRVISVE